MVVDACVYENKIKEGIQDVVEEVVLFGQGRDRLGPAGICATCGGSVNSDTVLRTGVGRH